MTQEGTDLIALAEQCERATGPDRELDHAIWLAVVATDEQDALMEQPELVEKVARAIEARRFGEEYAQVEVTPLGRELARAAIAALTTTADDALRDDAEWPTERLVFLLREIEKGAVPYRLACGKAANRLERIASRLYSPSPDGEVTEE